MKLSNYTLTASDSFMTFEFISEGPKGAIQKVIRYQSTQVTNVFNLAFGDKILNTNEIDDLVITNNGDIEKVLATVAASVYVFTKKYPAVWLYVSGSTKSRTRLYRMGISKFFDEIIDEFQIIGYRNDRWGYFEKNIDYDYFLVSRNGNILPL